MGSNIKLSVHLITFNNEKHIKNTLESILKQKVNFNYEIVVGDDCSTDNTLKIILDYEKNHPDLFKIKKNSKQLGILKNFKATLDRCNGNYIFDIAGDDLLKQDCALQKMVDALSKDRNLGFIDSGYDEQFDAINKTIKFRNKNNQTCNTNDYKTLILTGQIYPIGICYNKEHLYNYVDFDKYIELGITIEDYPILVDLIMNTSFSRINESLHIYRIHNTSYSHQKDYKKRLTLNKQMLFLVNFFNKKYNFPSEILSDYKTKSQKNRLYLAGYFGDKSLGNEMYKKLKQKKTPSVILNYLSSQNYLIRKLHFLFRKIK
ncbi:glycosyltransferase family 2 protein [Algibacter amylolyticus]|nr:glycosyltransferase family 2 protein [Algibacter amylolyticus]MBB5269602.1 glycosyltransferase involved in cell wall biosynthesis [Algibacter amylolyticus]